MHGANMKKAYWCFEDLEEASDYESKEFPWFNMRIKGIRECKLECRYRTYDGIHVWMKWR
jgi:hypothetical protein